MEAIMIWLAAEIAVGVAKVVAMVVALVVAVPIICLIGLIKTIIRK